MGRPLPGTRVRVVDPDGAEVPLGEPGEVVVAGVPGETVMTSCLHNPEATADTLGGLGELGERSDGDGEGCWLHTGDSATVDADELLAHCRERLSRFRVPDAVRFVDELPRTSMGKIQKHLLRSGEGQSS